MCSTTNLVCVPNEQKNKKGAKIKSYPITCYNCGKIFTTTPQPVDETLPTIIETENTKIKKTKK
eukprot:UN01793